MKNLFVGHQVINSLHGLYLKCKFKQYVSYYLLYETYVNVHSERACMKQITTGTSIGKKRGLRGRHCRVVIVLDSC